MTKTTVIGTIIAILLALAGFFIYSSSQPDSNVPQVPIAQSKPEACALFTETDAKRVLGDDAKKAPSAPDTTIGNVVVSHCTYKSTRATASILIRKANTASDAKSIFESSKKSFKGIVEAAKAGDDAYWVPSLGQYNILKADTWLIVTASKNKPLAQEVATLVARQL